MEEPIKGWIDNFNGPVGMMVGGGKGILRILYMDRKITSDFIPVDVAIKGIITASWQRGIKTYVPSPFYFVNFNIRSSRGTPPQHSLELEPNKGEFRMQYYTDSYSILEKNI